MNFCCQAPKVHCNTPPIRWKPTGQFSVLPPINWNLAGRARGQCVTVLSAIRSAPAAARNGTGQFSVLNDKFQFVTLVAAAPLGELSRRSRG